MTVKNKSLLTAAVFLTLLVVAFAAAKATTPNNQKDYPIRPVPFTDVRITDSFWAPRLRTNRQITIPYAFKKCEQTGRIDNFAKAANTMQGKFQGKYFNDSDVYKVIQAAAYSLQNHHDPQFEKYLDGVIDKIAAAQWKDGYLDTFYTLPTHKTRQRWTNIRVMHELYCAGHFFEAAVAYYDATGKTKILDVAVKLADHIGSVFGPGRLHSPPGHQEIEIGLTKLYRTTGNEKYLKLAKFFLDQRGRPNGRELYGPYSQDHRPVIDQDEAVGHAVRATYMYSGMADVAALTADDRYIRATDRIWDNVVSKKLYITGGVGARHRGEAFGDNYELPNKTAYNETCAAIGNALWNYRLFLLHGHAKYIDVLERVIYNGFLSGVSLSGDAFFYRNPLASDGEKRRPWFGCACCPTNVVRLIPSLPGYVYAHGGNDLYVNLFAAGSATVRMQNGTVNLSQQTRYPLDGAVKITVEPAETRKFAVNVRIPGWAQNKPVPSDLYLFANGCTQDWTIKVNGRPVIVADMTKGFARIDRTWKKGDTIELNLPMPIRRLLCHEKVKDNAGRVALQRGPVVYCAEWLDNGGFVRDLVLPDNAQLKAEHHKDLLGGITVISSSDPHLVAIPYYAWAHRGEGEMAVWLPRNSSIAKPRPAAVLEPDAFKHHVDYFNTMEKETVVNYVPNSHSWDWMKKNMPLFQCPDKTLEQIYYYRWWTYRKHVKHTPDGFVLTEFLTPVGHAGKYNTISCALGHHLYDGRWLHNDQYMDEYVKFWYCRGDHGRQGHMHQYSNWTADAVYSRYLVNKDERFIVELLPDLIEDHRAWENEKLLANGLFWQYDVRDGMEESISGSRHDKNARPPLNSYMYANAIAISKIAAMAGKNDIAAEYARQASKIKSLIQTLLWDEDAKFFEVRHENDRLAGVREEIGLIPWYFNLPDPGYEQAWLQIIDPNGFKAPYGLTTAEQRHPQFDGNGRRTCEWNGPVWPYATSQTLVGLANLLRNYQQNLLSSQDYFDTLLTYARSHYKDGKPYIGQYIDYDDGTWILGDKKSDRYYNHSTFCDLVIAGLVGLRPRVDDVVEVSPLIPTDTWDWFCLDNVRYHDQIITILWDKTGEKYRRGKGLCIYANGKEIARSDTLSRLTGQLPSPK